MTDDEAAPALFAESWDDEADFVLCVDGKQFHVRRSLLTLVSPVIRDAPDSSQGAEFPILGHSQDSVEQFLKFVYPNVVCAVCPQLIIKTAELVHFLGAGTIIAAYVDYMLTADFSSLPLASRNSYKPDKKLKQLQERVAQVTQAAFLLEKVRLEST